MSAITSCQHHIDTAMVTVYVAGMDKDENPIIRKTVSLREGLWRDVEEFSVSKGFVTTADAIRHLLRIALDAEARKAKK